MEYEDLYTQENEYTTNTIDKHTDKQKQANMHHSWATEQHRQNALCL